MDNFIDKLAQRFSAQEMIKANSQAETEEMRRLELQVSEYEKILQEMRKLHYKNTEISERLDQMIEDSAGALQDVRAEEQRLLSALRDLLAEQEASSRAGLAQRGEQQAFIAVLKELADGYRKERREALDLIGPIRELAADQAKSREAEGMRKKEQTDLIAALRGTIDGLMKDCQAQQGSITALGTLMEQQARDSEIGQGLVADLKALLEDQAKSRREELEKAQEETAQQQASITKVMELIDEKFQRSEDFVHKENVKVYRNVQAAMVDELKRYAENSQAEQAKEQAKMSAKLNKVIAFSVLSMLVSAAGTTLLALRILGFL